MKYTIESGTTDGWVLIEEVPGSFGEPREVAASETLVGVVKHIPGMTGASLMGSYEAARLIVQCAQPDAPFRKINIIKLHRAITGLGLRESKEAIEDEIAKHINIA